MQDNKPLELNNVKIDDIIFPFVQVYGLTIKDTRIDYGDEYGYGESATVITDIHFDLIVISLFDKEIGVEASYKDWESIKKQVKEHIFDDHEFMQQWQDREFTE